MKPIIVSGAVANRHDRAGAIWTRLSYALGLRRLGFQVYFVEEIDEAHCVDAAGRPAQFEDSANAATFRRVMDVFGFGQASALLCGPGERSAGLPYARVLEIAQEAECLINISGHLRLAPLLDRFRCKVFIDQDPGFTQHWLAAPGSTFRLPEHDAYFTIGENIGHPECGIPADGIDWRPTRQPVVLEEWPVIDSTAPERFTTIGSWRGPYGVVEHGGRTLGLKVHEFRKFVELPQRCGGSFELALDIHPADGKDLELLRRHGWAVVDPKAAAGDPERFRRYIQGSSAEFSVAQGIYVETNSGWFSDRTARYLASGKPALVQDTGFSRVLPVGEGLLAFTTLDEAVAGVDAIRRDYARHSRAARAIAEDYFDSDTVLSRLLDEISITVRATS